MKYLDRILKLIRKTGDKLVVMDEQDNQYVIMGIEQYEDMLMGDDSCPSCNQHDAAHSLYDEQYDQQPYDLYTGLDTDETSEEEERFYLEPVDDDMGT